MSSLRFFHGPFEVGVFSGASYPQQPGVYAYTPIQGTGHEEVQEARRAGAQPRCHFDQEGQRTSFTILASPRYGRFELGDFTTETLPPE